MLITSLLSNRLVLFLLTISEVHTLPHLNSYYCIDDRELANLFVFTSTVEGICVSTGLIVKITELKFLFYPV